MVTLDIFLGVLPYFIFILWGWQIYPEDTIIGLALGGLRGVWRHASIINWQTSQAIAWCCRMLFITTPERHWQHHQNANLA